MARYHIYQQRTPTKEKTATAPVYHANLFFLGEADTYEQAWAKGKALTRWPVIHDTLGVMPKEYL